ncbi:HlyD family efflux transporter periplasmic adaptor subunit [Pseudodesulfovibrio sp.]|uniref:efflux RND transporter periplasmic adaptor subunit n=1 Tax=Pseudodesulfovibrio sp. TaxID=2035812 RepID=UPI0026128408|nr:HlyD family efflux transporter periplasmic adaptor subunit [Pseudodesulfovibrio sp.]MDD3311115.1 HlyD family efflux transporter periplasmic adaptor subunit [Pseudodesulfovibrio sp.]
MTAESRTNREREGRKSAHRLDGLIASLAAAKGPEALFRVICDLGCEAAGAVGIALLARQRGKVRVVTSSSPPAEGGETPVWLLDLAKCYGQMLAENSQSVALGAGPDCGYGVFVPLASGEQGSLALAAYVYGGRQIRLQSVGDILQLVRAGLLVAERGGTNGAAAATEGQGGDTALLDVVDIVGEVQGCTRFFEAATTLCAQVARKFECRRAALGVVRDHHVKAVALDQMDSFARGTRSVRQLEEVMQEALDQDCMVLYAAEGEPEVAGVINRAARELATLANARRVLTIPLRGPDGVRLVMALVMDGESLSPRLQDSLALVCRLAEPRLRDLERAEELPLKKAWRYVLLKSADVFGPQRTALKLGAAVLGSFLFFSLIIPGEIEVAAPVAIEGVHSYTQTAPMDSYLYEVDARPGDEVKKGQLLGRLEATEVSLEIAELEAQKNINASQADQYLQEGKDAEAAIARLEERRTEANLAWARERMGMTELRSSVDGFVVSEDMFPRLGQPVRRGQKLFEITDTASLRVVAHVAEADISDIGRAVAGGAAPGAFTLTAYPDQRIPFTVERIHPFATVEDGENGFEVRGHIDRVPEGIVLRPGMEGHARIDAGSTPLLALWTRKLANRVRLLWWRWF